MFAVCFLGFERFHIFFPSGQRPGKNRWRGDQGKPPRRPRGPEETAKTRQTIQKYTFWYPSRQAPRLVGYSCVQKLACSSGASRGLIWASFAGGLRGAALPVELTPETSGGASTKAHRISTKPVPLFGVINSLRSEPIFRPREDSSKALDEGVNGRAVS